MEPKKLKQGSFVVSEVKFANSLLTKPGSGPLLKPGVNVMVFKNNFAENIGGKSWRS
jgi:hypothetical protein